MQPQGHQSVCSVFNSLLSIKTVVRDGTHARSKQRLAAAQLFNLQHESDTSRFKFALLAGETQSVPRKTFEQENRRRKHPEIKEKHFWVLLSCVFVGWRCGFVDSVQCQVFDKSCSANAAVNIRILFEPMSVHFPDPPPAPPPSFPSHPPVSSFFFF